jgi:hypothetical protein
MKKLTLDYYGEKKSIPYPKDFSSLSNEIAKNFQLNLSDVFSLQISFTKNKVKKIIQSEDDFKIFLISKASLINIEIIRSYELFQNNLLNFEKISKEDKAKLETLKEKIVEIRINIKDKEEKLKQKFNELKLQVESLDKQKAQCLTKLQNSMTGQKNKEKELVSKITKLAKEINAKLCFKLPENGPLPVKGNSKKEKEYLELIKQYMNCLAEGEKLFAIPRKNIDDFDKKIKTLNKKYYGFNKSEQEEIFELKNEEKLILNDIEKFEKRLGLSKNPEIEYNRKHFGKKINEYIKKKISQNKDEIKKIKEKIQKNKYQLNDEEKEIIKNIEMENKNSVNEIDKWTEFILEYTQELIESINKKNAINQKKLENLGKRIESNNSLSELAKEPNFQNIGATMPYTRYDSDEGSIGGGASIEISTNHDQYNIASQASKQTYVKLPNSGAYVEWTMKTRGRGVTMRFTLPDSSDGMGLNGSLDVYVNNNKVKTVELTSYFMWQYFPSGNPQDTPGGAPCFAFDEVHFLLDSAVNSGDKIKIQSSGANGLEYGVDFIEVEEVGDALGPPENSYSVVDYGANPNDDQDDYNAIHACIQAADAAGKNVYFPPGTYRINQIWRLCGQNMKISGAGIWYTNIQFTNDQPGTGGISGGVEQDGYCKNIEFCNMYLNSHLRSRYNQQAVYKCFMDVFSNCFIHDIWQEHFECGFWIADYNGNMDYSDGLKIINCRIRNNLADGVNFCQGTSYSTVYNCSIRNNGDDGLAMWNDSTMGAKDEQNNVFCYNTIDFIWRAGGIAVYGGKQHRVYNNYLRDTHMSSGIHLNTTFPGHKFNNNDNITFENNVMIKTGSVKGAWGEEFGAVDMDGEVKNITFNNTYIYDAQHDALHFGNGCSNIVFNNLYIYGAGTDGQQGNYSSLPHVGAAIMIYGQIQSMNVNNITLANIACKGTKYGSEDLGNYINLRNVTINGETDLDKTPYDYPNGPKIGNITVDGTIPEPDPSNNSNKKVIHPGIICDGCEKPIIGVRYKCTICNDFDFCESCEEKDKGNHGHPLLKINRPEMCPIAIECKLKK